MTDITYTRGFMAYFLVGRSVLWGSLLAVILGCRTTPDLRGTPDSAPAGSGNSSNTSLENPRTSQRDIQPRFTSYDEALRVVRSTYDCDVEDVNRSSVVFGAEYCDAGNGQGYLIVNLQGREYIHAGVPEEVWEEFRDAESMGSYYASNLRGHYRLTLAH